jgi:hypothetical protein
VKKYLIFFSILFLKSFSQESESLFLKSGDKAPPFILNLNDNGIQSFIMPYMKSITLLHFWSTDVITSKMQNKHLTRLSKKYKNTIYKNAEGFEVIAIAVQSDKKSWMER